ncbi:16S rRNA (uracil(1498)-N(3))-methyltransferase [uncultured Neptuniibacter sp.]|uniref:16S rRNA (uracil(1498)-N(3))-methyltransferase n=1 Tax=uncultured Neptuniibacter sp. TaxID=502143 RepID=UPI002633477F|nr:16S rRNA (uracil(1498)-N(3))-methyltransferase [uncultured Neptuniibacter sp.]
MNLILLHDSDFISSSTAVLKDRRFHHIRTVQQPVAGDQLKVGRINGKLGTGLVLEITDNQIRLEVRCNTTPPPPLPLTLILALPRPKMLKRILQTCATMGVKQLYLINSYRVDKSYWSSPVLTRQIEEHLMLGLEQAGDTLMPEVHLRKRFKPFVEDELPGLADGSSALLAHPYEASPCPAPQMRPTTLVVGPEGGFIPYEVDKLNMCGFTTIHIGERILRVETAIPALLSRLFPL